MRLDPNGRIELVFDEGPPPQWAAPSVGDLMNVVDDHQHAVRLIVTTVEPIPGGYSIGYMIDPTADTGDH